MPDKDLSSALSTFNYDLIKEALNTAEKLAGGMVGQAFSDMWLHYKGYLAFFIILFFFIKFKERGIGSVIYNVIYILIAAMAIIIFGWSVVFSSWLALLYPFSYIITGLILRRVKKHN